MTELIKKYNSIMERYKNGEFGEVHLTMCEILERAGEPDLIDKMGAEEMLHLAENSSQMAKQMFCHIAETKQRKEYLPEKEKKIIG